MNVVAVYADGGVIARNPSAIGGMWAWCDTTCSYRGREYAGRLALLDLQRRTA